LLHGIAFSRQRASESFRVSFSKTTQLARNPFPAPEYKKRFFSPPVGYFLFDYGAAIF
jgi:hypothetical protein